VSAAGLASGILAAAALAGTAYHLWAASLLRRFVSQPAPVPAARPPVTLLKPLCGDEPGLDEGLASFADLDYPAFQLVFGVHRSDDSALPAVERLRRRRPDLDIAVVVGTGRPTDGNPKIANLLDMMPAARHDILVITDSDMTVAPDYLSRVVAVLERPQIGIATSLYVGRPAGSPWSRLGAMGIDHGFLPSVMVAEAIGRHDGCFGATLALRRTVLDAVGGLAPLRPQLADDYLLGAAVRAKGLKIGLVPTLPRSMSTEADFTTLLAHEVRWGRTLASIDRVGYIASVVTQAVPLALVALAVGRNMEMAAVAVAALAGRMWAVRVEAGCLGLAPPPPWLVVARDLLSLVVQGIALAGRTVRWRGRRFRIGPHGVLLAHPVTLANGESPRP
jgi:ceramide glucosyltransferase